MANEGYLGKHTLSGERAATGDHPAVLHHLPLSASAKAAVIPVGTVMKRVDVMGDDDESDTVVGAAWEPRSHNGRRKGADRRANRAACGTRHLPRLV